MRKDLELLNANYSDALENNVALSKSEETSKRIIDTLTKNNEEVSFFNYFYLYFLGGFSNFSV